MNLHLLEIDCEMTLRRYIIYVGLRPTNACLKIRSFCMFSDLAHTSYHQMGYFDLIYKCLPNPNNFLLPRISNRTTNRVAQINCLVESQWDT